MATVHANISITDGKNIVLLLRRDDGSPLTVAPDIRRSFETPARSFAEIVAYFLNQRRPGGEPVYERSDTSESVDTGTPSS